MTKPAAKRRYSKTRADALAGYGLVLPTLFLFLFLTVYPFFNAFYISLTQWDGFTEPIFVGLKNFRNLFADKMVWQTLQNNLVFMVFTCTIKVTLGFIIAMFLKEKFFGNTFFRAIFFMPVIMSFVAIGLLWNYIFNPNYGLINSVLFALGIMSPQNPITWTGDPNLAMMCVIIVDIWRWTGYHVVLFMAGLSTIPSELYEAAMVDGASDWNKTRYITIPQMRGMILTNLIFCLTGALSVFDLIYTMTGGGPYNKTKVIAIYTYEISFGSKNQFGYATSINILLFFIILIITTFLIRAMNKMKD